MRAAALDELRARMAELPFRELYEAVLIRPIVWVSRNVLFAVIDVHVIDGIVNAVDLHDLKTGERYTRPTQGVFIFIGHTPNSQIFHGHLAVNDNGYVITDALYRTNIEGVFAAGEIQDEIWRQVATSVGQGVGAAMSAIHWLQTNEDKLQALVEEPNYTNVST